jgi:hypothetical protein
MVDDGGAELANGANPQTIDKLNGGIRVLRPKTS